MIKKIAYFGGSFNPFHRAHGQVVQFVKDSDRFDDVWVVPTYSHPFEKDLVTFDHRVRFCELALEELGLEAKVCPIEGELKNNPSYTVDTIKTLKARYPDYDFSIVVGSDCRKDLPRWKSYNELQKIASFFFIPRPGHEPSPFLDISSTQLRKMIRNGQSIENHVPSSVSRYIAQQNLYRD